MWRTSRNCGPSGAGRKASEARERIGKRIPGQLRKHSPRNQIDQVNHVAGDHCVHLPGQLCRSLSRVHVVFGTEHGTIDPSRRWKSVRTGGSFVVLAPSNANRWSCDWPDSARPDKQGYAAGPASTSFTGAAVGSAFIADLKPRIPSPSPLPSSGSFLGPKIKRAKPTMTNKCMG